MSFLDFQELQVRVRTLFLEHQYEEAIRELENAKGKFPTKIDRIGHWLSGIHCLQGNQSIAISELNEVLEKGLWWNPVLLMEDEELSSLQGTEEFATIIKKCEASYNYHKQTTTSQNDVQGNQNAKIAITALHWRNSNIADFSEQIVSDELKVDYLFSFIQSSQLFSQGCYEWNDYEVAKNDILKHVREVEREYDSSIQNHILFGTSQGADTAIKLCLENNESFHRAIAVVPTLKELDEFEKLLQQNKSSNVKIIIVTGDQDHFYEHVMNAFQLFEQYGVSCELIVIEGMGHSLPQNFHQLFPKIIDNIIK